MTKQELIEAISEMLGLEVTEHPTRKYAVELRSPVNRALIMEMELREEEDGTWHYGGYGSVLRKHHFELCRLGDEE